MSFAARAAPSPLAPLAGALRLPALALPFLFGYTQPPMGNFWPLMASWGCLALLLLLALAGGDRRSAGYSSAAPDWAVVSATQLALGLLCAALLAGLIGLLQYFLGDPGLPGLRASTPGQAIGNLRQRNQQASLIAMGLWALLWLLLHRAPGWIDGAAQRSRRVVKGLLAALAAVALLLLTAASAATASRTGALQWLLVLLLAALWPAAGARASWRWRALALATMLVYYALAAAALPVLLKAWSGVDSDGLFTRLFAERSNACNGRGALWSNMLHLIAQKPWAGWGWGELDYAHYLTLFPGQRFCALLDNAHNLPLHLAVELGLPMALLLCGLTLAWALRSRPWSERQPRRQLAWGLLAIVGLHSMLEFPLWYGPFQCATLLALALLCQWPQPRRPVASALRLLAALLTLAALASSAYMAVDYYRISQLYRPLADRPESLRRDTVRKVGDTPFFTNQVDFALLSSIAITPSNAGQVNAVAHKLLHFSPEPRVIEPLIESARLLGEDDEAAFHIQRYRAAFPADYAHWREFGRRVAPAAQSTP